MGESTEVGRITEMLTLKARTITLSDVTPLIIDAVFETTARSVAAESGLLWFAPVLETAGLRCRWCGCCLPAPH